MPDLDTREDDWARGVFDRVRTGQPEPRWAPDAEGAARVSTRRRRRTQFAGAVSTAAVIGCPAMLTIEDAQPDPWTTAS